MKIGIGNENGSSDIAVCRSFKFILAALFALNAVFFSACNELEKPASEPFFAQATPPKKQEFRWSNGKLPKSFDPAAASAPPETDVVRAIYEGLTETDPATLNEVAGVAESWESNEDFTEWTFKLRTDAKWTNGKPVTAEDFVRSWTRLIAMGKKTAHRNLFSNIAGVPAEPSALPPPDGADLLLNSTPTPGLPILPLEQLASPPANSNSNVERPRVDSNTNTNSQTQKQESEKTNGAKLGIVAGGDHVLKITLAAPDKDFPKLVANPIFRPVYGGGEEFQAKELTAPAVTNGPFQIASVDADGVILDRSETYWNRDAVKLERVHFVPMDTAEKALAAYRSGELDAVTNADFAPLVLKLLTPYEDFRRTTHSALNFYDINSTKAPFSDRRVRQALSNAIEREKLTEGEMEGVTRPALSFLPYGNKTNELSQDKEKAKDLLDDAGFPDGKDFPVIRLLINRNDTQQRIARSVAKMWKQNLNLETEIIVKEAADLETARNSGDFDLMRRGIVLPTSDEAASFMAIFDTRPVVGPEAADTNIVNRSGLRMTPERLVSDPAAKVESKPEGDTVPAADPSPALTEEDALYELRAIPLYFPMSFSLVRPYISGFEMNGLDALTLSNVAINNEWQPAGTAGGSK